MKMKFLGKIAFLPLVNWVVDYWEKKSREWYYP